MCEDKDRFEATERLIQNWQKHSIQIKVKFILTRAEQIKHIFFT